MKPSNFLFYDVVTFLFFLLLLLELQFVIVFQLFLNISHEGIRWEFFNCTIY